jgi:prepilin peptidase CpaA
MTFPALHLLPLGACLAAGTIWDLARRRIPNAVSLTTACLGVLVQAMDRGGASALSGVAAGAVTVALLYRPWVVGGIGGGDVKLAAAAAIWVGLGGMIRYALAVSASGGAVAIVAYLLSVQAARREMKTNLTLAALQQRLPPVPEKTAGRVSVPYGVAVSAGALITFLTT